VVILVTRSDVSLVTVIKNGPCASGRTARVCLAIPGQVLEVVDEQNRLAKVDVAGVRRNVNIGLLDVDGEGVGPGDWVLIHVGFAISQVDEEEARATRDLLERMGADYEQELEELKASVIE
jgi:hydrogenase expression/formation protein HypC